MPSGEVLSGASESLSATTLIGIAWLVIFPLRSVVVYGHSISILCIKTTSVLSRKLLTVLEEYVVDRVHKSVATVGSFFLKEKRRRRGQLALVSDYSGKSAIERRVIAYPVS